MKEFLLTTVRSVCCSLLNESNFNPERMPVHTETERNRNLFQHRVVAFSYVEYIAQDLGKP
jgi:hypothetical protein